MIIGLAIASLHLGREDGVQWESNANGDNTIRSANWQAVRDCNPLFERHKLIWHKDTIPGCGLILWVVFKYKLGTNDKLIRLVGCCD